MTAKNLVLRLERDETQVVKYHAEARRPTGQTNARMTFEFNPRRKMRNVIYAINITLDGCCDHTKMIADEEIHEYFTDLMRDVDLLVFGRKTYQLMVPFWPDVAKNR